VDNKSKSLQIIGLVLFASIVVWVARMRSGVESVRPPAAFSQTNAGFDIGTNKVWARLWQDPFEAFAAFTNKEQVPSDHLKKDIQTHSPSSNHVAILAVMLPGTPYSEDKELRRRQRYALQVAVLSANFGPEDPSHIKYGQFKFGETTHRKAPSRFTYEWFAQDSNQSNKVLALWLNEDDFVDFPLEKLDSLLTNIGLQNNSNSLFYLLGPSSATLKAMVGESNFTKLGDMTNRFRILSTRATAADAALLSSNIWPVNPGLKRVALNETLANFFGGTNGLHNWIAPDDQSGQLIAKEIDNRLVGGIKASERVVTVTEQDTFYGRNLQDAVTVALTNANTTNGLYANAKTNGLYASSKNVWQFSYLRGLDGSKPPSGQQSDQPAEAPATPEALLETVLQKKQNENLAFGDAQLDYATRLGEFLSSQDTLMRQTNGRIIAVGLTGSDVYDKLNLLQALRQRLPGAVFFTTDLDARLWSPDFIGYSRGLLVASGYALDPDPARLSDADQFMPFRDVYQTAIYKATQAALTNLMIQTTNASLSVSDSTLDAATSDLSGRLYVIGRNGPVRLDKQDEAPRPIVKPVIASVIFGLLIAVVFSSLWFPKFDPRQLPEGVGQEEPWPLYDILGFLKAVAATILRVLKFHRKRLWLPICIGVVAGLLFITPEWVAGYVLEEPLSISSGVSMWPCEYGRILVFVLGLLFFPFAWKVLEKNLKDLKELVCPTSVSSDPDYLKEFEAILLREAGGYHIPVAPSPPNKVNAYDLIQDYSNRAKIPQRHMRTFWWVVGYSLLAWLLFYTTGETPDRLFIRGAKSNGFDVFFLFLAILPFQWVLFYVVDGNVQSWRFLRKLGKGRTAWELDGLKHHSTVKGVRMEHLDGWLDVKCAAVKTRESWKLMICPFVLLFLLVGSRNSYFGEWTWNWFLVTWFVANFCIAAYCWERVRRMAKKVRKEALKHLDDDVSMVESSRHTKFWVPTFEKTMEELDKSAYLKRLKKLRDEINANEDGAYAHPMKDKAYWALFSSAGSSGILIPILGYWIKHP
jgi:hypothetical protein